MSDSVHIVIDRIKFGNNSCLGKLHIDDDLSVCYTLEDLPRERKIPNETAIPTGTYKLGLRNAGSLNTKYSNRFNEDHPMLWLKKVPNYKYVYFHIGNTIDDTSGCILVGETYYEDNGDYKLIDSTKAYRSIYYKIRDAITRGETVTVTVRKTRKTRKPILNDIPEPRLGVDPKLILEKEPTELPDPIKPRFYQRTGFKRWSGGITAVCGGVLSVFPPTAPLGGVLIKIGGSVFGAGLLHGLFKKKKGVKQEEQYQWLIEILKAIIKLITKKGK